MSCKYDRDDLLPTEVSLPNPEIKELMDLYDSQNFEEFNSRFLSVIFPDKNYNVDKIEKIIPEIHEDLRRGFGSVHDFLKEIVDDTAQTLSKYEAGDKIDPEKEFAEYPSGDNIELIPTAQDDFFNSLAVFKKNIREYDAGNRLRLYVITDGANTYHGLFYRDAQEMANDLLEAVAIKVAVNVPKAAVERE